MFTLPRRFFLFLQKLFLIVVLYEISKFILLPTTNQFHNNFYMIYEGFVCGREKKANALSNACYISFFLLHFSSFWKGRPFLRPDRLAEIALNWPSMAASHSVAAPAQMLFDEIPGSVGLCGAAINLRFWPFKDQSYLPANVLI